MNAELLVDKAHRILGKVVSLDDEVGNLQKQLDGLKKTVEEMGDQREGEAGKIVTLVSVNQQTQLGMVVAVSVVAGLALLALVLLCLLLRRSKKMKVRNAWRSWSLF